MLKVLWGIDPPPPKQKCLKLVKVKNVKNFQIFLKALKTGEMLKMLRVFWGIDPPPQKKGGESPGELLTFLTFLTFPQF